MRIQYDVYTGLYLWPNKYSVSWDFTGYLNCLHGFIVIHSFCFCTEHRAFLKLFHLVLSKASPFASFQFSPAFGISHSLFLFQFFFVYLSSLYLEDSSPVHVFLLHLVDYIVWPIQCLFLSFICCSVGHNSSFEVLTGYMTFQCVIGIRLQSLGVNYLSV